MAKIKSTIINEGFESIRIDYLKYNKGTSGYEQSKPGYVEIALVGNNSGSIDRVSGFVTNFKYKSKKHVEEIVVPKIKKAMKEFYSGLMKPINDLSGWKKTETNRGYNDDKYSLSIRYDTNKRIKLKAYPKETFSLSSIQITSAITIQNKKNFKTLGKDTELNCYQVRIGKWQDDGMYHTISRYIYQTESEAVKASKDYMNKHQKGR